MDWMQVDTLKKFLWADVLELKDLRPKNVDSNLFSYHLSKLKKQGLITSVSHGRYQLTLKGKHLAGLISKATGKPTSQPKIAVMIYARDDENYLLFKWKRQPYNDQVSLPYGKIHFGENPVEAVSNELKEKSGLEATFKFIKDIYVKVVEKETTLTHMLVHVYAAINLTGELVENVSGKAFWAKLDKKLNFVPGFHEIITVIESDGNELKEIVAKV